MAIKDHNTAVILAALRSAGEGGTSQAHLANVANLTPQAISKIVGRLSRAGLISSAGRGASTGGKPPTLLRLQSSARQAVGIHLDRHQTTFVLDDLAGGEVARQTISIGMEDAVEVVLKMIEAQVRGITGRGNGSRSAQIVNAGMLGVGIACPGPLDQNAGVLREVSHLPHWHNFPLRHVLSTRLGSSVVLSKDTDAAARAVLDVDGNRNHAYVHFGDGLGAGLILEGNVYQARSPYAGEFGHQVIDVNGPTCDCGRRGCVEAVCLLAMREEHPERAAELLAIAVRNLGLLVGLDQVTLGGAYIEQFPELFREKTQQALLADSPEQAGLVMTSTADAELVAHGAAAQILDRVFGGTSTAKPETTSSTAASYVG